MTNAAPTVRRLADFYCLSLDDIRGTGTGGRITVADVERAHAARSGATSADDALYDQLFGDDAKRPAAMSAEEDREYRAMFGEGLTP